MSEWLNKAFSGGVSLSRVNPLGILLIFIAVVLICAARPASNRLKNVSVQAIQFAGLILCAVGTAITIL